MSEPVGNQEKVTRAGAADGHSVLVPDLMSDIAHVDHLSEGDRSQDSKNNGSHLPPQVHPVVKHAKYDPFRVLLPLMIFPVRLASKHDSREWIPGSVRAVLKYLIIC